MSRHPRHRVLNRRLIGLGGGLLGGGYVGAVAFGQFQADLGYSTNNGLLFVPLLGPALWGVSQDSDTMIAELVVLDTALQAAGAICLAVGLSGREGWERKPGYLLLPTAGAGRAGVVATGRFKRRGIARGGARRPLPQVHGR